MSIKKLVLFVALFALIVSGAFAQAGVSSEDVRTADKEVLLSGFSALSTTTYIMVGTVSTALQVATQTWSITGATAVNIGASIPSNSKVVYVIPASGTLNWGDSTCTSGTGFTSVGSSSTQPYLKFYVGPRFSQLWVCGNTTAATTFTIMVGR